MATFPQALKAKASKNQPTNPYKYCNKLLWFSLGVDLRLETSFLEALALRAWGTLALPIKNNELLSKIQETFYNTYFYCSVLSFR